MTTKQDEILPECIKIFERMEGKLDNLIARADKANGHYEAHLSLSNGHSTQIALLQDSVASIRGSKSLILTTLLTLIVSVILAASAWGSALRQIEINTDRLDILEASRAK